jgi:hypothetical protein
MTLRVCNRYTFPLVELVTALDAAHVGPRSSLTPEAGVYAVNLCGGRFFEDLISVHTVSKLPVGTIPGLPRYRDTDYQRTLAVARE